MSSFAIKILVLDDDPLVLKLLARMLESLGYTSVSTCDSGNAALKLMDNPNDIPDLILLDINMPEMDGLEFVRRLVERSYAGGIILVSAEDERLQQAAEKLVQAHRVKVLGHLNKPPSREALAGLIGKWVTPQPAKPRTVGKIYSVDEVRAAIANGELVNYYQPKVDVATGHVIGAEALVRWRHPVDGLVFPDQFIGVAEEHGLIDDLTRVVLTLAVGQIKSWQETGLMLQVAINLSMDNLRSPGFLEEVAGITARAGVPPQMVELEVTESRLMGDLRASLEILSRLRLKRFRLSLDDFGTGNSSLAQLRDLPFDELKIDRSFVHGAWDNEKLRMIFEHSLNLANQLGMAVVAEGVEDRADWDFVRKTACNVAQGYFIAEPMPAADLPGWIRSWQKIPRIPRNIRERGKLFEMACRVALESGLFRLVWIGLFDQNSGTIVCEAQAGHADGYFDSQHNHVFDAIAGHEPSGMAIKSGSYVVCNDISSDPRTAPWREEALRCGYRACVAFPLRQAGNIIGVFSFYLDEHGSVTDDLIQLISTLAEDLSSMLDSIDENSRREIAQVELRELVVFQQSALENERKRIARELHDELGQTLTALRFDVKWLHEHIDTQEQELQNRLHSMQGMLERTVDTVRRISEDLRPGMLDDLGLAAAIEHHSQKFIAQTGIACELRMSQTEFELGEQASTTMFRIVQESLTNVARHSGASRVVIDLRELGDQILLIVQDNGRGLPVNQDPGRKTYGLLGMRERVKMLGGTLDIFNETGAGVRIEACIPKRARTQEKL